MEYTFESLDRDAGGRIGRLHVGQKRMTTPNIFVVINPRDNLIPPPALFSDFSAEAVFTNAYIIYKSPELRALVKSRGIESFLDFKGVIATDSGAFQHYMYEDALDITPEEIESFQEQIQSDCPVILDVPVQLTDSMEEARAKVQTTIQRAKENIQRRTTPACWMGPVHGTLYLDLVRESARRMGELDFGIYALGGLVKTFINYNFPLDVQILCTAKKYLPEARPVHMFGLGLPQFFALAVACGCDTMDSAAYALYAKEDRYFTLEGTRHLSDLREFPCSCPECTSATPKQVRSLEKKARTKFLARHNLYLTFQELRTVREAIREGNLWELVEQRVRSHPRLIDALNRVQQYLPYLETKESSVKRRGFFYTSVESTRRPLVRRIIDRILNWYQPDSSKKIAIIIPELDVPAVGSPAVNSWLVYFDENLNVPPKQIHILFANPIFGLIPREIAHCYPLSQNCFPTVLLPETRSSTACLMRAYFENFPQYESGYVLRPVEYQSEKAGILTLETHPVDEFLDLVGDDSSLGLQFLKFDGVANLVSHLNQTHASESP